MDENHIDAETEEKIKEQKLGKMVFDDETGARVNKANDVLCAALSRVAVEFGIEAEKFIKKVYEDAAVPNDEELSEAEQVTEDWIRDAEEARIKEAENRLELDAWIAKYEKDLREYWAKVPTREAKEIGNGIYEVKLTAEEMRRDLVPVKLYLGDPTNVFDDNCKVRQEAQRELAETPLVYQKEFFGFLLTVTKNSVGILIELHTSVKASAVFGLCCRFLTGLGVPAAQIGGVEPIFSEWLPFPDAEL